jgi:hypothetical protein
MICKVEEYLREDGTSPYEEWFMKLDTVAAAKITTVKVKIEQGNLSNIERATELWAEYNARKARQKRK